ncbi:HTH domain-containing protein [Paenibacillus sp. Root444D2]
MLLHKKKVTAEELAKHFEVSKRTICGRSLFTYRKSSCV